MSSYASKILWIQKPCGSITFLNSLVEHLFADSFWVGVIPHHTSDDQKNYLHTFSWFLKGFKIHAEGKYYLSMNCLFCYVFLGICYVKYSIYTINTLSFPS